MRASLALFWANVRYAAQAAIVATLGLLWCVLPQTAPLLRARLLIPVLGLLCVSPTLGGTLEMCVFVLGSTVAGLALSLVWMAAFGTHAAAQLSGVFFASFVAASLPLPVPARRIFAGLVSLSLLLVGAELPAQGAGKDAAGSRLAFVLLPLHIVCDTALGCVAAVVGALLPLPLPPEPHGAGQMFRLGVWSGGAAAEQSASAATRCVHAALSEVVESFLCTQGSGDPVARVLRSEDPGLVTTSMLLRGQEWERVREEMHVGPWQSLRAPLLRDRARDRLREAVDWLPLLAAHIRVANWDDWLRGTAWLRDACAAAQTASVSCCAGGGSLCDACSCCARVTRQDCAAWLDGSWALARCCPQRQFLRRSQWKNRISKFVRLLRFAAAAESEIRSTAVHRGIARLVADPLRGFVAAAGRLLESVVKAALLDATIDPAVLDSMIRSLQTATVDLVDAYTVARHRVLFHLPPEPAAAPPAGAAPPARRRLRRGSSDAGGAPGEPAVVARNAGATALSAPASPVSPVPKSSSASDLAALEGAAAADAAGAGAERQRPWRLQEVVPIAAFVFSLVRVAQLSVKLADDIRAPAPPPGPGVPAAPPPAPAAEAPRRGSATALALPLPPLQHSGFERLRDMEEDARGGEEQAADAPAAASRSAASAAPPAPPAADAQGGPRGEGAERKAAGGLRGEEGPLCDAGSVKRGLRLAIAVTVAACLAFIPGIGAQLEYTYWAPVTVAFVAGDNVGGSFHTSVLRLQGTVAGAMFGYIVLRFSVPEHLASAGIEQLPVGSQVAVLLSVALWTAATLYSRADPWSGYGGLVAGLTACLVVAGERSETFTLQELALSRIVQTCLGIVVLVVAANTLWPKRASHLVLQALATSLERTADVAADSVLVWSVWLREAEQDVGGEAGGGEAGSAPVPDVSSSPHGAGGDGDEASHARGRVPPSLGLFPPSRLSLRERTYRRATLEEVETPKSQPAPAPPPPWHASGQMRARAETQAAFFPPPPTLPPAATQRPDLAVLDQQALELDALPALIDIATAEPHLWAEPFAADHARTLCEEVGRMARATRVIAQAHYALETSPQRGAPSRQALSEIAPLLLRQSLAVRQTIRQTAKVIQLRAVPPALGIGGAHALEMLALLAEALAMASHDMEVAYERVVHHRIMPTLAPRAPAAAPRDLHAEPLPTHQVLCFNAAIFAMRDLALATAEAARAAQQLAAHLRNA